MRLHTIPFVLTIAIHLGFFRSSHSLSTPLLEETLGAVDRLLGFFRSRLDQMDHNSALGVAIAEGQLSSTIRSFDGDISAPFSDLIYRLENLKHLCSTILFINRKILSENNKGMFKALGGLLKPWLWDNGSHELQCGKYFEEVNDTVNLKEAHNRPDGMSSDSCIAAILARPCKGASPACWREEFEPEVTSATNYALSHRLIYAHVARKMSNCSSKYRRRMVFAVCAICEKILNEAKEIERRGFPSIYQDLFMEQVALCGMEGFRVFTNPSWLRKILAWQRPSGCYGNVHEHQTNGSLFRFRFRRSESAMVDGCLSHASGVALASLVANVRFLAETS